VEENDEEEIAPTKESLNIRLQGDIENLYPAIGVLRVLWKNLQNEVLAINYGTAFAVSANVIATSAHNIYSERREQFCT
jgi:hypothetical protein